RIELKVDVLLRRVHPVVGPFAVQRPKGFIRVHGAVARRNLFADVVGHWKGVGRQQSFKADESRGSKAKLKEVLNRAGHFTETDADAGVQIDGHRAKPRSNHAAQDLALSGLLNPMPA